MKPQVINGMTFEMAQTKVERSKYAVVNRFKRFTTAYFDYNDMLAEADMAIFKAWQEWDPEQTLFNTYVTNMIQWMLYRALDKHHPFFKMNVMVKNDMKARGETFISISKKGKTCDQAFNKEHGLDGKTPISREIFNQYVYKQCAETFGYTIRSASDFTDADGEDFDILTNVPGTDVYDHTDYDLVEMAKDSDHFSPRKRQIVEMLINGDDLGSIARHFKTSKFALMREFAPGVDIRKNKKVLDCEYT
jgi:hypothetical protein